MTAGAPISVDGEVPSDGPLRVWAPILIWVVIACIIFAFAFRREIDGAVSVWMQSTAYNHCFLVLPLAGALLWTRRETIIKLQPRASPWALALVPILAVAWTLAALLEILEAEQLLTVALFEVLLLAVLGRRVFCALLAPLLFLFFLVPFGEFLVPALQRFTADFAVDGLRVFGIPVFANGFTIQIPEGTFEVAEACAGLRFLIASIVFGCFFGTVMYSSPVRRTAFIVLSILVPIIANGVRALGIIVLGHLEGSAMAVETDHILYGWIFFSLVTLLLIIVGMTFADQAVASPATPPPPASPPTKLRIGVVMTLGLAIASLGPVYLMMIDRASATLPASPLLHPPVTGGWARGGNEPIDWEPTVDAAKQQSIAAYQDDSATVVQLIALFPLPARDSQFTKAAESVINPKGWRTVGVGRTVSQEDGISVPVNTSEIVRQQHRRLVWLFYVVDDQMTASTLVAKLLQARAAFLGGVHIGAIIAISTEADDLPRARVELARFLGSMRTLRSVHPAHVG